MLSFRRIGTTSKHLRCLLPRSLSSYTLLHPVPTTIADVEGITAATLPAYRKWLANTRLQEVEPKFHGQDLSRACEIKRSLFMLVMRETTADDVPIVLHLMSAMNASYELNHQELEYIVRKMYKYGTEEEIKTLRRILSCDRGNDRQYEFLDSETALSLFVRLAKFNNPNEIIHWYTTLHSACGLPPNAALSNEVLIFLTSGERILWDGILYVLGDMHFHGIPVSMRACIAVLKLIPEEPSGRWRLARQLLLDLLSNPEITERGEYLHPELLSTALLTLYNARQSRALLDLYQEVHSRYQNSSEQQQKQQRQQLVLPIYDPAVLLPLGLAAVELDNLPRLIDLLRNSLTGGVDLNSSLYNETRLVKSSQPDILRARQTLLLVEDTLQLMSGGGGGGGKGRAPSSAGYHTGLVILWLLRHDKTALAVHVWNTLISKLVVELSSRQTGAADGDDQMARAVSQVFAVLCQAISARSGSTDSTAYAHHKKIMRFLSAASFSDVSGTESGEALRAELTSRFADLTLESVVGCDDNEEEQQQQQGQGQQNKMLGAVMSVDLHLPDAVANAALTAFLNLHEKNAAFALWKRCLERSISVDERLSNALLDQLVEDGDYALVIELCDFLVEKNQEKFVMERARLIDSINQNKLFKSRSRSGGAAVGAAAAATPSDAQIDAFVSSQQRGFSPYLFAVGMKAMAASGDTDALFRVLLTDIPSRGFIPSNSAYAVAIQSLRDSGKYAQAVQLFQICCDQRSEFIALNKALPKELTVRQQLEQLQMDPTKVFHKKINFTNHSLAVDSPYNHSEMLLTTLECCAHARLGLEAMRIFSERENLMIKGLYSSRGVGDSGCGSVVESQETQQMLQHVLVALASPEYCSIIPDFLVSTSTLLAPIMPNRVTLTLAVAAAVSVQDAATVERILQYARGFSYELEEQVQTKENLLSVVQHRVMMMASAHEVEEQAAWLKPVLNFLERCEHFVNLK